MPCCEQSPRRSKKPDTRTIASSEAVAARASPQRSRDSDGTPLGGARGYALLLVVVATMLVVTASGIALAIAREGGIAAIRESRAAAAHAAATTGLQWLLTNLASNAGRSSVMKAASSAGGTPVQVLPGPKNLYRFDADARFAGVPTAPPARGTTTTDWTASGEGHFGLLGGLDPFDPTRSVVVRAIGVVGDNQVVLETNLPMAPTQNLPSGITGCFASNFQITFHDQQGPYDYTGNFRLDGTIGVPWALSADHDRINGLARTPDVTLTVPVDPAYRQGVRWRGQQNLRSSSPASRVANIFGGVRAMNFFSDGTGPFSHWIDNPYLSNDPRIVDAFDTTRMRGLGLGPGGGLFLGAPGAVLDTSASITQPRGLPLIAFLSAPTATTPAQGGFLGQSAWATAGDDDSRKGFYGCSNAGGIDASLNDATNVCLVGTTSGTSSPDWGTVSVNESGRAWGFAQAVLRQCTGSGNAINPVDGTPWWHPTNNVNGVRCANGFDWLENLAACLIVPREAASSAGRGTNPLRDDNPRAVAPKEFDDGNDGNNFSGCHPGCLIATDVDGDGDVDIDDRPFRSVCVNLDAANAATYGPGMIDSRLRSDPATRATSAFRTIPEATNNETARRWTDYNVSRAVPGIDDTTGTQATRFVGKDGVVRMGGVVQERGNPALIARLDMSDRGPLGTCEQNCLAYGFGNDRTYGAHRAQMTSHYTSSPIEAATADVQLGSASRAGAPGDPHCVAEVPSHTSAGTPVLQHCNWDANYDGLLDRVSYALNSAYREECTPKQDGIAWSPAFDISTRNTSLAVAGGCVNELPGMHPDTSPMVIAPFCDDGSDAELRADVERLVSVAQSITPSALNKNGNLVDGAGWWGGARCHMGQGTTFNGIRHDAHTPHTGNLRGLNNDDVDSLGRPDYWIEDSCPKPVVLRVDSNASLNIGQVCGCGILIMPSQSISIGSNSHLLWRGLILWDFKQSGRELQISGRSGSTLVVEGGMLMTGLAGMQIRISKSITRPTSTMNSMNVIGTVKQLYRYDPEAVLEAFQAVPLPVRAVRRVR
jgi:hypothetical protein